MPKREFLVRAFGTAISCNQILKTRKIGDSTFMAVGFGTMGLPAFYSKVAPDEERFKILDAVPAAGCTLWDTADIYGDSEELIGKWWASAPWLQVTCNRGHDRFMIKRTGKRTDIFLSTKFRF
ncbi:NADP-dependent oxidoreductase domain-containing protein [Mycena maculata]|uniref:NADP-dependent oxidoreductase domain-containing protein n=1 Tax=Mycena maculata TaxID=230809 RepID=A0AAD7NV40_9AGAR|nr:NADP-dependent oxidoreductase domain-containing protein [Mycena maculata]